MEQEEMGRGGEATSVNCFLQLLQRTGAPGQGIGVGLLNFSHFKSFPESKLLEELYSMLPFLSH